MTNKISIKTIVCVLFVIVFIWWLWPNKGANEQSIESSIDREYEEFSSAIEPVSDTVGVMDKPAAQLPVTNGRAIAKNNDPQMQLVFSQAKKAIVSDNASDRQAAIKSHIESIKNNPQVIELYINLAAIYAADNQLEAARTTLMRAVNIDKKYVALVTGLQKIYGALAANAYKTILDEKPENKALAKVNLPIFDSLAEVKQNPASNNSILQKDKRYIAQLESTKNQLEQSNNEQNQLIAQLQQKIQLATSSQTTATQTTAQDGQLAEQNQQQRIKDKEAIASLQSRLSDTQLRLKELQTEHQRQLALLESQLGELKPKAQASKLKAEQNQQAIGLVKSWAKSWAKQDVAAYIAHYKNGYSPTGLSNSAWKKQRQIRLTNKKFIKVNVNNFKVSRQKDGFAVTFSQRYRTDRIDDTIKKRLSFKSNSNDWQNAKIVAEKIIR